MYQQFTKIAKFGLTYNKIDYVWLNKKLFRLPYFNEKTKREYDLKEVKQIGNHYLLSRNKVHLTTLKRLTKEVNKEVVINVKSEVPF